jgi:hypothetical protein
MTAARLKRLTRLESRQVRVFVPFNYAAAAAALRWVLDCYAAVASGKASLIPRIVPPCEPSPAKHEALRYLNGISKRLAAEPAG